MTVADRPSVLSKDETQRVRQQLRAKDGPQAGLVVRIGGIVTNPLKPGGDSKRHRFGVALMVLAVFQMMMLLVLPDDPRRWLFFGFAWLTLLIGARKVDTAK